MVAMGVMTRSLLVIFKKLIMMVLACDRTNYMLPL